MSANQKAYQAEQASATAVSNAAQLQREVLRLSNQMDSLRLDLQTQSNLANSQQVCVQSIAHMHTLETCSNPEHVQIKAIPLLSAFLAHNVESFPNCTC